MWGGITMAKSKTLTLNEKKYKKAMKDAAEAEKKSAALSKEVDKLMKEMGKIEKLQKSKK